MKAADTDAGARVLAAVLRHRRRGSARVRLPCLCALLLLPSIAAHAAQWFVQSGGANVSFSPQFLTITAGDSVTFLNLGGYHNAVADDGSFRCAHGCDGDGRGGSGNASSDLWFATVTFPTAGTVGYFCEPHGAPGSGMYGTITVSAPARPIEPAPGGGLRAAVALGGALIAAALLALRRRAPATPRRRHD